MGLMNELKVGIAGGGTGACIILDIARSGAFTRANIVGLAYPDPNAAGYRCAVEMEVPVFRDFHDLYAVKDLNLIIETDDDAAVAEEIARTMPVGVSLMSGAVARLFYEFLESEEKRIAEYARAQGVSERRSRELRDRVREINCLYATSSIAEKRQYSLDKMLQETANIVTSGWQYRQAACARIEVEGREFRTRNFKKTDWRQTANIVAHGNKIGELEVGYLEEKPPEDEGPFLKYERDLINAVARRIARSIERRQAQESLQESEKRFRTLVENAVTGILIIQDDRIVYQNPEQERICGPLAALPAKLDFRFIHSDDRSEVEQGYARLVAGQVDTLDMNFCFYPSAKAEESAMKWVDCRALRIEYHNRPALLVNMMDVTRSKELERLVQIQDKMTSLGRVAAGIAHEIRNPLSGINLYLRALDRLCMDEENNEKTRTLIGQIQSASDRIDAVIRRVIDFSRPGELRLVRVDINRPIEDAIALTRTALRKIGIALKTSLSDGLPPCRADADLITQVIVNLITNAAEEIKEQSEEKIIEITSEQRGSTVRVTVADSGKGVPPAQKEHIFDPFYTTKKGNTGIGLSLCYRIITDHGGKIDVDASRWGGARFVIELRIVEGA